MSGVLTSEPQTEVRAVVAEMICHALLGANDRITPETAGSVVMLPVFHADRRTQEGARHHG